MTNTMNTVTETLATAKSNQNRFKRTKGSPKRDQRQTTDKWSENEFWKKRRSVEMQRVSRTKNSFELNEVAPTEVFLWPYENGMPKHLEEECKKPLGPGW
jgi:hypothetical protein